MSTMKYSGILVERKRPIRSPLLFAAILGKLRLGPKVRRLHDPGIHRRDHIHGAVEVVIGDPGFPCVRKASLHSILTVARQRHGEPHERLLPLAQVAGRVRVAVELAKIAPFGHGLLLSPFGPRPGCFLSSLGKNIFSASC
jgi:hypothetical protein